MINRDMDHDKGDWLYEVKRDKALDKRWEAENGMNPPPPHETCRGRRDMMLDMKGILKALRANPRRFVHISTGSQYHPRRLSPGHVRPDAAKGETYNVGRNAHKRAKRALHRMGRGLAP